jgi:membrane associated rhomboid family serine protease
MSTCDVCGRRENMPYRCNHCGGTHCANHRLPEAHDCPGLESWGDPGGVFDSGFDDSVSDDGRSRDVVGRLLPTTGSSGVLAYFKGNVTYTVLALMVITFFLQFGVVPLAFGAGPRSDLWAALFTIHPQHIEYVWTWVTHVFAHSGITHLAVNGILIFFFGRIVERYVGSKQFAALFLVAGDDAGLSQVGLAYLEVFLGLSGPQALTVGGLGASGAALAIMGVLTVLRPDLRVYVWFVLPVPIWVITILYAGTSVLGIIPGYIGGNVAHMAHLAGLICGLAYGWHVKGRGRVPQKLQIGTRRGPGGPGGPGGGRGPF